MFPSKSRLDVCLCSRDDCTSNLVQKGEEHIHRLNDQVISVTVATVEPTVSLHPRMTTGYRTVTFSFYNHVFML
jgi:hypothetical protein